jgi:hypothetical protein
MRYSASTLTTTETAPNKPKAAIEAGGLPNMSARGNTPGGTTQSRKQTILLTLDSHKDKIIMAF